MLKHGLRAPVNECQIAPILNHAYHGICIQPFLNGYFGAEEDRFFTAPILEAANITRRNPKGEQFQLSGPPKSSINLALASAIPKKLTEVAGGGVNVG